MAQGAEYFAESVFSNSRVFGPLRGPVFSIRGIRAVFRPLRGTVSIPYFAKKEVKTAGEWSKAITNDRKLLCYAFFKQVNNGDVTGTQPWAVQFEARSKWDAWNKIKGVSKEKAMEEYVKEWEQQKIDFNMPKE